jgi:hypothetical protein
MHPLISRGARLLVAATALVVLAPAAVQAAPTGSITGAVTAASTHLPIAGVRACAVSENSFEEVEEFCAHSAANGSYSIGELPEARYRVEFISASEGLNYIYQAWDGKPDPFEANRVKVTTAEISGIDAMLSEGGMIGGLVTSNSSGKSIAGVEVCAEPEGLEAVTVCTSTDGGGQYTILGLAAGGYWVGFRPPEQVEFLGQYFDREPGELQADSVPAQPGHLTPGVNATLLAAGQIAGRVTDAITNAPIAGVSACTFTTIGREAIGPCGESGTDGRYLIRRVQAGAYTVHFFTGESVPRGYGERDYTGVCGDDPVTVTVAAGVLTSGIEAGLFPLASLGRAGPACTALAERPPTAQAPKPKRCKKGTKRKIVHGRRRCVRIRKHRSPRRPPERMTRYFRSGFVPSGVPLQIRRR